MKYAGCRLDVEDHICKLHELHSWDLCVPRCIQIALTVTVYGLPQLTESYNFTLLLNAVSLFTITDSLFFLFIFLSVKFQRVKYVIIQLSNKYYYYNNNYYYYY